MLTERNQTSGSELEKLIGRLTEYRWYDAMVTGVEETANRYKVNVHAAGIGSKETHKDIVAICPDAQRLLVKGTLCKVILDGKIAMVMPHFGPYKIVLDMSVNNFATRPRQLQGWLADPVKGIVSSYKTADYRISMTYSPHSLEADNPNLKTVGSGALSFTGEATGVNATLIGFLWPSPTIVKDKTNPPYVSVGFVFPEGGGSLPTPTARYQVITILDDALTPIWDFIRFN